MRCGNTEAKLMPPLGDYSEYHCPSCGMYHTSGTMEMLIENGVIDPASALMNFGLTFAVADAASDGMRPLCERDFHKPALRWRAI
jgi:hypothetical protein